jgi:hypothetical protein
MGNEHTDDTVAYEAPAVEERAEIEQALVGFTSLKPA